MMKRFLVFIFLFLAANFIWAQDMPPLPTNAPPSAGPNENTMPALPDSDAATPTPVQVAPVSDDSSEMPALPDASASAASTVSGAMPALPDTGEVNTTATPFSSDGMPPLPASSITTVTPSQSQNANANASPVHKKLARRPYHPQKPWQRSFYRPNCIFGGWIHALGGDTTDRLAWSSQQILDVMDEKGYQFVNEQGVYAGEINQGPQYRQFTFHVPHLRGTVMVYLREVDKKVWLRVGPDEEPAPADHTYAQVEKIRREDLRVMHILRRKFGYRLRPHYMAPNWDADYNTYRGEADD